MDSELDYPIDEVAAKADNLVKGGATIHQKWTCELCNERVTMNEPNAFFRNGVHEECPVDPKHETKIERCNFLLITMVPRF